MMERFWSCSRCKRWRHPLLAGLLLILGGVVIGVLDLDRKVMKRCFVLGGDDVWPLGDGPPWSLFEDYGTWPANAMFLVGLLLIVAGKRDPDHSLARKGWAFSLSVALGPLLLVNAILKGLWTRPRPRHLQGFFGTEPFRSWWLPFGGGDHESFPSGHAASAFVLIALALAVDGRDRPWLKAALAALVVTYGGLVSYARLLQGAHFLSDVWFGGGIGYLAAVVVDRALERTSAGSPGRGLSPLEA